MLNEVRKKSKIKGRTVSIGFDKKKLPRKIGKGNSNGLVVLAYIPGEAGYEGEAVVMTGNFQEVGMC